MVLLGAPGSGKGTQGALLSKEYGVAALSTGDLFRRILEDPAHPLYKEVEVVRQGMLVGDDVVNRMVEDGLTQPLYKEGAIFDGYPRTVSQAEALDGILMRKGAAIDCIVDFDVSEDVLLQRLLGRRVCAFCKRVYHISQGYAVCPACSGQLVVREDDNEETIRRRFEEYQQKTAPVRAYYRAQNVPYYEVRIQGKNRTPEEVMRELEEMMHKG